MDLMVFCRTSIQWNNCRYSMTFLLFQLYRYAFNNSNSRIFLDVWKICSVTPVLKSGNLSMVTNYSPISILSHLGKIIELIIYNNVRRSLYHVLIDEQHGFCRGKSTITSNIVSKTYISDCLEVGSQVDVVTTNFKKAFDTVSHKLLIVELKHLDVGKIPFNLV